MTIDVDQVMDFLGSAAFSKAVQALDIKTGMLVCLKIVKVRQLTNQDCTSSTLSPGIRGLSLRNDDKVLRCCPLMERHVFMLLH